MLSMIVSKRMPYFWVLNTKIAVMIAKTIFGIHIPIAGWILRLVEIVILNLDISTNAAPSITPAAI